MTKLTHEHEHGHKYEHEHGHGNNKGMATDIDSEVDMVADAVSVKIHTGSDVPRLSKASMAPEAKA
jgi:hypothetical protein